MALEIVAATNKHVVPTMVSPTTLCNYMCAECSVQKTEVFPKQCFSLKVPSDPMLVLGEATVEPHHLDSALKLSPMDPYEGWGTPYKAGGAV